MSDPSETIHAIDEIARNNTLFPGVAKMVQQPSEHRALAGGIGPLTFVGSGYGVMLVLMVSGSRDLTDSRHYCSIAFII